MLACVAEPPSTPYRCVIAAVCVGVEYTILFGVIAEVNHINLVLVNAITVVVRHLSDCDDVVASRI